MRSPRTARKARLGDARFVLDELGRRGWNLDKVGMFGHSFGGFTAAEAMLDDQRIDAGMNMNGHLLTNLGEVAERGLDRPVFLYGRQEIKPGKTVEHAGSKMYATASRRCTLLFPAFDPSTEDGRGAGNGSRMAGPISCAKYGLEVPVGGGGPTLMITGVTREPAA
ncbi:hypothetical protein AB0L65_34820 [Nonomuraea sp. NPDC052116]|uniref:hypothetical protein n=1 Tax=Nonomuraea sp. NPDC052116 TaxID=3155665 RepID=UPI003440D324